MGLKAQISRIWAKKAFRSVMKWANNPIASQEKVLLNLITKAKNTRFGQDHNFGQIFSYEDFKSKVPVRDYEGHRSYIERIRNGEEDVLWKGRPLYWSKTSGTTSGTKFIPISKESMPSHIIAARNALLLYIHHSGNSSFVDGKMIFLQGSPELSSTKGIKTGRLSGIVANYVPGYLLKNRMPSMATNCIEDWETKVDEIVKETLPANMTLISGIPSWVQMYYERLLKAADQKTIAEVFPNLSLFVWGGVNFGPYQAVFDKLVGKQIDAIETYPASEGFIAFQDTRTEEGLLLCVNGGIFFEFVPREDIAAENPSRIDLSCVELDKEYAILLSTNAGLWAYNIGDTVKFVSLDPYRIKVTGRISQYTSAFGEHVISQEIEVSIKTAMDQCGGLVVDFHMAPQVTPNEGLPYHEWFIEFAQKPEDLDRFKHVLDSTLQQLNIYYKDLISGNVLRPLEITEIRSGGFVDFMKTKGKLGGQNKIPRLSNDRTQADLLQDFVIK